MVIHWTKLLYNKFRFGLHPSMLTEKGYKKKLVCRINDGLLSNEPREILFDRQYVVEYLGKNVVSRLKPYDIETINELLKDAEKL